MIDEIYFLKEEKQDAETIIKRMLKLKEDLEKKRETTLKRSNNVAGYDEKIKLCNMRIIKQNAKIAYITNILKFIESNK